MERVLNLCPGMFDVADTLGMAYFLFYRLVTPCQRIKMLEETSENSVTNNKTGILLTFDALKKIKIRANKNKIFAQEFLLL